jgi:hypothetical protein
VSKNPLEVLDDAEKLIAQRVAERTQLPLDQRSVLAIEHISDELVRLRAELKVLRGTIARATASLRG